MPPNRGKTEGLNTLSDKKLLRRRMVIIQSARDRTNLGGCFKYPHNSVIMPRKISKTP